MTETQEFFAVTAAIGLAIGLRLLVPIGSGAVACPIHPSIHPDCIGWELKPAHAPAPLTAGPLQRTIHTV